MSPRKLKNGERMQKVEIKRSRIERNSVNMQTYNSKMPEICEPGEIAIASCDCALAIDNK